MMDVSVFILSMKQYNMLQYLSLWLKLSVIKRVSATYSRQPPPFLLGRSARMQLYPSRETCASDM